MQTTHTHTPINDMQLFAKRPPFLISDDCDKILRFSMSLISFLQDNKIVVGELEFKP